MSEKRFVLCKKGDVEYIEDNCCVQLYGFDVLCEMLNEQQATITEYEDFCYNLCMFIIGKDLDDEFREKYGKEYNIITKWKGCGSDEV